MGRCIRCGLEGPFEEKRCSGCQGKVDPTMEEIWARAREIREGWPEKMRLARVRPDWLPKDAAIYTCLPGTFSEVEAERDA